MLHLYVCCLLHRIKYISLWVCVRLLDLDFAHCDVVWCWTIHPSWQADEMGKCKSYALKHFAVPVQSVNTNWRSFTNPSVVVWVEYLLKILQELLLVVCRLFVLWLVWQYFLSRIDENYYCPSRMKDWIVIVEACEARAYLLRQLWTVAQRIVLTVSVGGRLNCSSWTQRRQWTTLFSVLYYSPWRWS